ncbi:PREDICTED: uncharacterized protein LOC109163574 [Ipomoea nil]|uniref:uncharacterized protein LOC109163574 n=1 Tax=Ipomoea nil TaxID=35883 RepID=UPI00090151AF|nr:PREDICTED: uncharacterized protein LOC109163574 [Ipomoea nil]
MADQAAVAGLTAQWADMVLAEEEGGFVPQLADGQNGEAVGEDEPLWGVVGRFLTRKLVKLEFMSQVMASVWQPVSGVQASEIQPGVFLFVFHHITDVKRVLEEGPWSYDNSTFVCKQVPENVLPVNVKLDTVDMWVQIHELPMGYTSELIQEQIGNYLGVFVKRDDRFQNMPWRTFYRVRVSLSVDRPLKRRMKFIKRDKTSCWVYFKYERLHTYCYFCEMLGHSYKFCRGARDSVMPVEEYLYGPDLRARGSRGPRPVGGSWLLPLPTAVRGSGSGEGKNGPAQRGVGSGREVEGETGVVAVAKRRREGLEGEDVGYEVEGSDVVMADRSKNLQQAGTGSQARPTQ